MAKFSIQNFTKRSQSTRMSIGDAVIELMNEKDFDNIKILDITRKANVSRMTFYKYYYSKEEVVVNYLHEVVAGYMELSEGRIFRDFPNYENTLQAFEYFDKYAAFFLGMARAGLYSLLIEAVNEYVEARIIPNYDAAPYQVYYYAGAILNIFIKWEENGKDVPKEQIAKDIASIKYKK